MANVIFTKLPKLSYCIIKFDNVPVVIGTPYDLSDSSKFTIEKTLEFFASPLATFKYKIVENNGVLSKETNGTINFDVDISLGEPELIDVNYSLELEEIVKFRDIVSYEPLYDRIKFTSITGKGRWFFENNEQSLELNKEYMAYEVFENLKFDSNAKGAENDYSRISFIFSTKLKKVGVLNTIQIDTNSYAELHTELTYDASNQIEEGFLYIFEFKVKKSFNGAYFLLNINPIEITDLLDDPDNYIEVKYGNSIIQSYDNISFNFDGNLDENGEGLIQGKIFLKEPISEPQNLNIYLTRINDGPVWINKNFNELNINVNINLGDEELPQ